MHRHQTQRQTTGGGARTALLHCRAGQHCEGNYLWTIRMQQSIMQRRTTGQLIPGLWIRCRRKMCFNVGSIKVLKLANLYIEYHYQEGRNAPESSNSAKREDNRWFPSNKQGTRYLRRYKASRDRYHFYIEQKTGKKWMAKKGNSSAVEREPRSYPDRPDSGTMIRPGTAGRFCGAMRNICITINEIGPVCESYGALRWL